MPFGFGGGTSSTVSSSESRDQSQAGSVSGGSAVSGSQDQVAFEDIFARMFGGAEGAAAGLDPSMLTGAANQLFGGGIDFMSKIGADKGSRYLEDRLAGDNDVLQQEIDLLGEDLGRFFDEQLLPGITTEAAGGGQLGGGRQGVAQTGAMQEVGNQFTRGATALRSADVAARDQAAGVLSGNAITGAQTALAGIPALAGVADMGFSAGMAPYERLAAILGGPTVLNTAGSRSSDFAKSFSSSYGYSRADSKSSSRDIKLAF